ncbi:MAG: TolC family protein [Armatimonadetes bacterium]|nr:TolC family protein [Armatimonadota bacterium]
MDSIRRAGACASVLLLLSVAGAAAEPAADATAPWTLDYCIQTAFEKHGDVLVAEQNIEAARAQHRSAGSSLFWPTISARSTRTEGETEAKQSGTTVRRVGKTSDEQHLLSGSITLWDGGTQRLSLRQARAGETSAEMGLRRARQTIVLSVTSAYIQLLRARHTLAVTEQKMKQIEEQKKMVQARIEVGDAADVDIYPIEAQLASARVEQVRAASDVRVAGSALRNAMGLEGGAVPTVAELPAEWPEVPSLEECRRLAHEARPELAQSLASIERERASVSLSKLRLLPQLTSSARWDRGLGGSSIVSQWSINAGVSWSFFNRGDRADVDAAKASLRATEEQHQQLLKNIDAEVEQAYLALASARERIAASQASVEAARKSLEAAEAKYRLDLAIPLEIIDAQVAYSNAELQAVEARYDYYLACAQLDRAIGRDWQNGTP